MQFTEVLQSIATRASVANAQQAIRATHGRGASRWLADTAGISRRTARRWLSGAYPRGRRAEIVAAARDLGAGALAAPAIAAASKIDVGQVRVFYRANGRDEGTRHIGSVTPGHGYSEQCAAALIAGSGADAEEAFSDAVISGYEDGLEETLSISDYQDGVALDFS